MEVSLCVSRLVVSRFGSLTRTFGMGEKPAGPNCSPPPGEVQLGSPGLVLVAAGRRFPYFPSSPGRGAPGGCWEKYSLSEGGPAGGNGVGCVSRLGPGRWGRHGDTHREGQRNENGTTSGDVHRAAFTLTGFGWGAKGNRSGYHWRTR